MFSLPLPTTHKVRSSASKYQTNLDCVFHPVEWACWHSGVGVNFLYFFYHVGFALCHLMWVLCTRRGALMLRLKEEKEREGR